MQDDYPKYKNQANGCEVQAFQIKEISKLKEGCGFTVVPVGNQLKLLFASAQWEDENHPKAGDFVVVSGNIYKCIDCETFHRVYCPIAETKDGGE